MLCQYIIFILIFTLSLTSIVIVRKNSAHIVLFNIYRFGLAIHPTYDAQEKEKKERGRKKDRDLSIIS